MSARPPDPGSEPRYTRAMRPAQESLEDRCDAALALRSQPDGSFASRPGGESRVDATAWAAMALAAGDAAPEAVRAARAQLAAEQREDGRLAAHPDHPQAAWPTPLAILAWLGDPEHTGSLERAVTFLLESTGLHWPPDPAAAIGHDTSIEGWPWIQETHSWVEPTSLCMLALSAAGRGGHPRVREAARLLLDRRLPGGGWNYGNSLVFGSELRPLPESTGVALHALAGRAATNDVEAGLAYLAGALQAIRTPFTLGWGVMGLAAWGRRPPAAEVWLSESLERQSRFGAYDTAHLALLALAARRPEGLLVDAPKEEHG